MSKYGNRKVEINGILFDSLREARRYTELRILERAGHISNLEVHKKYVLIPTQRDRAGKLLEQQCSYYADFSYIDNDSGKEVVEDTKGVRTEAYRIKRKMMLYVHGIIVKEI